MQGHDEKLANRLRQKPDFSNRINAESTVQSWPRKYSALPVGKSSLQARAIPHPGRGALAIVTDVGCGMRWTLWRRVDERRKSGRRSRVVLTPRRWRHVGDDA